MASVRAALRSLALILVTTPLYTGLMLCKPLALASKRLGARVDRVWIGAWTRLACLIVGIRLEVRGVRPVAPFFLVSNHLSYLDVIVLGRALDARFLSKAEVSGWPVLGRLSRAAGTLYIDRKRHRDLTRVIEAVREILAQGRGVVVFPEGTSSNGASVEPFRSSLFEVALSAEVPVYTATLGYGLECPGEEAHMSVCWWGDMTFGSHFWHLLGLPSITATLTFGSAMVEATDRKTMATRARAQILTSFQPVVVEP